MKAGHVKSQALRFADACENKDPLPRKAPTLRVVSKRFLEWVDSARLVSKTKTYYQDGWRLLTTTSILGMRLDAINNDVAERLNFTGSAANTNCALRTLRRLLHRAEEWKLIRRAPKIKLLPEKERSLRLDDEAERKLWPRLSNASGGRRRSDSSATSSSLCATPACGTKRSCIKSESRTSIGIVG